jgi:hypothetical protein
VEKCIGSMDIPTRVRSGHSIMDFPQICPGTILHIIDHIGAQAIKDCSLFSLHPVVGFASRNGRRSKFLHFWIFVWDYAGARVSCAQVILVVGRRARPLAIDHRFPLCRVAVINRFMFARVADTPNRGDPIMPVCHSRVEISPRLSRDINVAHDRRGAAGRAAAGLQRLPRWRVHNDVEGSEGHTDGLAAIYSLRGA